jgi:iron(III) transport system permease protein
MGGAPAGSEAAAAPRGRGVLAAYGGYAGLAFFLVLAAILVALLAAPLGIVLGAGLVPLDYLREVFLNPVYLLGLRNSAAIAVITTAGTLALALPLAWLAVRVRYPGQRVAELLLLAPLVLPPFVGALGVWQLLGHDGVVNTLLADLGRCAVGRGPDWLGNHRFAAVCVLEILALYPMPYLLLTASFARLDPALLEAAHSLGATPWRAFRRVALPLAAPALAAAASLVFVWSFTELGTPLMLGYDRCTPAQVYAGLSGLESNHLPFALVVVMLAVAVAVTALGRWAAGGGQAQAARGAGAGGMAIAARPLAGWRAFLPWAAVLAVALPALAPQVMVALIAVGGDWYRTLLPTGWTLDHARMALAHPLVVPGIVNSLICSGAATVLALALGVALAWSAVRWRPPGWQVLDAAAMLPLAIPGIIFAFGYLGLAATLVTVCHQWGLRSAEAFLSAWVDPFRNPIPLLVVAYAVRRLPHVVRTAAAGLQQAPVVYEEAAAALGAGRFTRLRRITLPLIAGSLGAGALLAFSLSMLEVADSLVLAQNRAGWPITRVIYDLVGMLGPGPATACAFATWAMLFLTAALVAAGSLFGGGAKGIFRGRD